ncbi:hypothetical protein J2W42_003744 [Rhizobium tibeticum]|nr:hypothetical protein [Rhizobium tibeticum]
MPPQIDAACAFGSRRPPLISTTNWRCLVFILSSVPSISHDRRRLAPVKALPSAEYRTRQDHSRRVGLRKSP